MPIVFAGIMPHSPLLLNTISKEKQALIQKTVDAVTTLEQEMYVAKPDLIVVISAHEAFYADSFAINAHNRMSASFENFGDLSTTGQWKGASELAAMISHNAAPELPIQLISNEHLEYGTSVPLIKTTTHLDKVKVLPVGYSNLSPKQHLNFGSHIKETVYDWGKRVAILCAGDMSHCHGPNAPAGPSDRAETFDNVIIELLENKNTTGMLNFNAALLDQAKQNCYHQLLILLGMCQELDYTFKTLSYENPFGVGYLVGQLEIV